MADDENAGYSGLSTGPAWDINPPEVEITPEHPEGELKVVLPPKAGFIQVHLTNRKTGSGISAMRVALMPEDSKRQTKLIFDCGCAVSVRSGSQ